jgi:fumarate hydratase class II
MKVRIEKDTMGQVHVPADAYYGAQTQRAVENFPVSGLRLQPEFVRAQAIIKRAAARLNADAGLLAPTIADAIIKAADEILEGRFDAHFVVDVFQAGAGTSQNMNVNEVLANRAAEHLGGKRGDTSLVHPNDHPNMGQSTNDTIHAAIHIAGLLAIHKELLPAMRALHKELEGKAQEFDDVVKIGRTHLQDATPIRLGQLFGGYAAQVDNAARRVNDASDALGELALGGTAVGTGLNTAPHFRQKITGEISAFTGITFRTPANPFEAQHCFDAVVEVCGALRTMVTSLRKIADDFRLLSSGPRTGMGELKLPPVQPGSSIMPGKVNPVMAEMLNMACFHAMGLDTAIVTAAQAGQMELNVMMPVIAYDFLQEIQVLAGAISAFTEKCVKGLDADRDMCRRHADMSNALATALAPEIGYARAAEIAKKALAENTTVREIARRENLMSDEKLDELLDLKRMTQDPSY